MASNAEIFPFDDVIMFQAQQESDPIMFERPVWTSEENRVIAKHRGTKPVLTAIFFIANGEISFNVLSAFSEYSICP